MNTATKITLSRFVITPLFFLSFYVLVFLSSGPLSMGGLVLLWGLFILSELSDVLDGYVARKYDQVSDLGKLMDPFADVIFRVTYFVCFAAVKWVPWWAVMIILWREYTIMFIRMLLIKEGTALAARFWGKLKAGFYFLTGLAGMALLLLERVLPQFHGAGLRVIFVLAGLSALMALISLTHYLVLFARRNKK
ncbi:MAG: CDP-diacylglycerol--glycerol-3-phosphate 3-phosphatidyltransferase [Spirochaetales bacterium]|nr:CDP-diacylglycerol--glycerol-3-phosphate 3-phosphatidyltransferase [Spirochaetales bacterium]